MSNANGVDMERIEAAIKSTLTTVYKNSLPSLKACVYLERHILSADGGDQMPVEITIIMEVRQK